MRTLLPAWTLLLLSGTLCAQGQAGPGDWRQALAQAEAHGKAGRPAAAAALLEEALSRPPGPGGRPREEHPLYTSLVKHLAAAGDARSLARWAPEVHAFFLRHGIDDSWHGGRIGLALRDAGTRDAADLVWPFVADMAVGASGRDTLYDVMSSLLAAGEGVERAREMMRLAARRGHALPEPTRVRLAYLFQRAAMDGLGALPYEPGRTAELAVLCLELAPRTPKYAGSDLDAERLSFFAEMAAFLDRRTAAAPPAPTLRLHFRTLAFRSLDADWTDRDGTVRHAAVELDGEVLAEYQAAFRVFSRMLSFLSGGLLEAENRTEILEATVRRTESVPWKNRAPGTEGIPPTAVLLPDRFSAGADHARALWERRDAADCFVWIVPMEGMPYTAVHVTPGLVYVPGVLQGPLRFGILLHSEAARRPIALMHEFFHAVEYVHNRAAAAGGAPPLVSHVFQDGYGKLRPDWFSGADELRYYQAAFRNVVLPLGLDRLAVGAVADPTSREALETALQAAATGSRP